MTLSIPLGGDPNGDPVLADHTLHGLAFDARLKTLPQNAPLYCAVLASNGQWSNTKLVNDLGV